MDSRNDIIVVLQFLDDKSKYFIRELTNICNTLDTLLKIQKNVNEPIIIPFTKCIFINYMVIAKAHYDKGLRWSHDNFIYYHIEKWMQMYKPIFTIEEFIKHYDNLIRDADIDLLIEILQCPICTHEYINKKIEIINDKILSHYQDISKMPEIIFQYVGIPLLIKIYQISDIAIKQTRLDQYIELIRNFHEVLKPQNFGNVDTLIHNITQSFKGEDKIFMLSIIGEKCIKT